MTDQKSIPRSKLHRGSIVGATAARVGVKTAGHLGKRPFLSPQKRLVADLEHDQQIARLVFDALSVLRGTALKAAQLLAMESELLPETLRQELAKAASEVPPLNRALVRKVLNRELGPPERVFASIASTPFAAASLGQVHAATSHGGAPLAVKVQYPGIAAGVESDVEMLQALLAPTKYGRIFAASFDEISRKIRDELDYRLEARNLDDFRARFDEADLILPVVYPELTTRAVITTSRIDGRHLEAWLATSPSQAQRDHYGQLLVDFFNRCVYRHAVIHADPNPGNFLFRDDGRLGVIDFGCIKRLEPDFVHGIRLLSRPEVQRDPGLLEQLHGRLGIHYRAEIDRAALAAFLDEWVGWLSLPYQTDRFDFSRSGDFFARGAHLTRELYRFVDRYDGDFTYFARTEHGLMRLLQRLGARVRMRPVETEQASASPGSDTSSVP